MAASTQLSQFQLRLGSTRSPRCQPITDRAGTASLDPKADRLGSRHNPHTRSQIRRAPETWRKRATSSLAWHAEHHAALTGPAASTAKLRRRQFSERLILHDAADQNFRATPLQRQYQRGADLSGRALSGNAPTRDAWLAGSCPATVVGIERGL